MAECIDGLVLWFKIPYSLVYGYQNLRGNTRIIDGFLYK